MQQIRTLSIPGMLTACSWEGLSPRLGIAADNFVYFASVRHSYRVRSSLYCECQTSFYRHQHF